MRVILRLLLLIAMTTTVIMIGTGLCEGQLLPGQKAPDFCLDDIKGKTYDLSTMSKQPMIILYFFDVESRPSQEGLLSLDQLAKQYEDADLIVWGITLSPKKKVAGFVASKKLSFPALLDRSAVSDLYHARLILPTVCILGPDLKLLDYLQGGGKSTEIMLVKLAERKLQRKQTMMAKVISEQLVKKNPQNLQAQTVRGYAAVREGNLDEAEEVFQNLSKKKGQGEVLGKEGLTAVYAKRGQTEKAFAVAKEVEKMDPKRGYVHVVKGDLLYSQGKKEESEAEYQKAVQKEAATSYQRATAYNQFGRFYASLGEYQKARELYDQAVDINPYYVEAMSNKGITYEKEGEWDKALDTYGKAITLDKNDYFAAVLAKKAQEMLALQKDIERKKRVDRLVKELADRYRGQRKFWKKAKDTWTSRPMVMSFVDFQEKGGLLERDGFSMILTTQLTDHLNNSGRVQVVERVLIERLLEELNLSSSDLVDPETVLKLGKVLAAKLIGTGSLYYLPTGTLLNLRLIDTETSAIPKVVTRQFSSGIPPEKELQRLNRDILRTVMLKYPLCGYVVQATGDEVLINLGSKQGVVLGTKFEVLEEQKPIKYKGKLHHTAPKPIAEIEIVRVEPDLCSARILNQERSFNSDAKVREKVEDVI